MASATKLDPVAKRIAAKLSRGELPPIAEISAYLEERPESLLDSLTGFRRQLEDETGDEALAQAYLMLMTLRLELLRYEIDGGYERAKNMLGEFEDRVVALARSGDLSAPALGMITSAMHEVRLRPGADLLAVSEAVFQAEAEAGEVEGPADMNALLEQIARQAGDDVFTLLEQMDGATHAMPPEIRVALAEQMMTSGFPVLKEAAPLAILDARPEVRQRIASSLLANAGALTSTALRRLIAIRTWLSEDERRLVDQAVQAARANGVACAGWEAGGPSDVRASVIDGSGAHGFLAVTPAGRRQVLSSLVLKHAVGVLDAWSAPPAPKREIARTLEQADAEALLRPVSGGYLDRAVRHHLAVGLETGAVPPAGLLQVAETVRATDWRPIRLDWRATLDALTGELPAALRAPTEVAEILETSADWAAADGFSDSWFEDDQEVDNLLGKPRKRQPDKLLQQVLSDVIEPRRLKWAERFLWVALWLKEGPDEPDLLWPSFAVVARELVQGRRVDTIPLMEDIALRTIAAMRR